MATPRDQLKLDVMFVLKAKPMMLFELAAHMTTHPSATTLAAVVDELVRDGYVVRNEKTSTVELATATSLSDLRATLLPSRDPVREAHEHEQTQGRSTRYRRVTPQGADLGEDE